MKKIYMFEFNEGVDGTIIAKNLKHACRILGRTYNINFREIYLPLRKRSYDECIGEDFQITWKADVPKYKGVKSEVWGFCE